MTRNIKTVYTNRWKEVVQTNSASNPNSASMRCFNSLQMEFYDAETAEVYNIETGEVYAQFKVHADGKITCYTKYDTSEYMDPIRRAFVQPAVKETK